MGIIRRACMLAGITLKLFSGEGNADRGEYNIRLGGNFKLSSANVSTINAKLKTMKAEPKDLMVAMQEA